MNRPEINEYDPYYESYVSLVPEGDIVGVMDDQTSRLNDVFAELPQEFGTYRYAEGKWTVKEVISHLIDGERMFAYRVFRIARGDKTPIEGFEQDGYIENSHANNRSFAELLREFELLRNANTMFFKNLHDEDWVRIGTANEREISVRALAYIMAGHVRHHIEILKTRYLAQ
ncbi:MAG: DinB family protein [Pyrinomonadaceae bacterium]